MLWVAVSTCDVAARSSNTSTTPAVSSSVCASPFTDATLTVTVFASLLVWVSMIWSTSVPPSQ